MIRLLSSLGHLGQSHGYPNYQCASGLSIHRREREAPADPASISPAKPSVSQPTNFPPRSDALEKKLALPHAASSEGREGGCYAGSAGATAGLRCPAGRASTSRLPQRSHLPKYFGQIFYI